MSNPTTQSRTATKRKYRITEFLTRFDSPSATAKRKEIMEFTGIKHKGTLSAIENIKANDQRMIPHDWAVIICRIIGCPVDKFINT